MTFQQKNKKPLEVPTSASAAPQASQAAAPALKGVGPLSLVVERARRAGPRGSQEQDWSAVGQKVAAQYQALGGRATQQDLLSALRAAVSGQAAKPAAARPAQVRPRLGEKPRPVRPAPAPAKKEEKAPAARPGKAPQQVAAKAGGGTRAKAKAPAKAAKPSSAQPVSGEAPKLAGARKGAPASKKPGGAAPEAHSTAHSTGAASGAKAPGGGAGARDLKVLSAATLAGLEVGLSPTWQKGGKLVFEGAAWRKARQQVQKALTERQRGAAPTQTAEHRPEQAQTGARPQAARKPRRVKLPSASISATELKRHEQQNRQKNTRTLAGVVARVRKARAGLSKVSAKATPQITAAQRRAEAQVQAALKRSLSQIAGAEQAAKSTDFPRLTVGPQPGRGLSGDSGELYFGGTGQIFILEPWKDGKVLKSFPLGQPKGS